MILSFSVQLKFVFFVFYILNTSCEGSIHVQTQQGLLRGYLQKTRYGKDVYHFLKVPFAQPPIGDLRLKDPQPHPGWSGERDATEKGPQCLQMFNNEINGTEDCLYLNIYTPQLNKSAKLSVMFFIHGGAFSLGSGNKETGHYLTDEDVILVTTNYRLGVLGFMSFNDDVIPGNFALKDVILALKWVQENIHSFGGDRTSVTIFGNSAGGAIVDFLLISPLTTGLFHKAIMQSGSALCFWATTPQVLAKRRAHAFSTLVQCPTDSTKDALKCLQRIPEELFVTTYTKFQEWNGSPMITFSPVVDDFLSNSNLHQSVLPAHPSSLQPHNIPVMMGLNSHEGNMFAAGMCINDFKKARDFDTHSQRKLILFLNLQDIVENEFKDKIANELIRYYLNNEKVTKENIADFEKLASDVAFGDGQRQTALQYYKTIPVYFFVNDIEAPRSLSANCTHLKGPSHSDEIIFLFKELFEDLILKDEHEEFSKSFVKIWTAFAKIGHPHKDWTPMKSKDLEYFLLEKNGFKMKSHLFESRLNFIDSLSLRANKHKEHTFKTEL